MANKTIGQLDAAALPLAGTEKVELETAAGASKRATAQDVANVTPAVGSAADVYVKSLIPVEGTGTSAPALGDLNVATAIQPSSVWLKIGFNVDPTSRDGDAGVGATWEHNPVAATLALLSALQYRSIKSAVAINSYAGFYQAAHSVDMYRKLTAGGGGFQAAYIFGFTNGVATRRFIMGVGPYNDTTALDSSANPSTKPNLIGLLKDSGDTNVQIAWTSNSSVPTKIDTGVSFVSLSGKTLRFVLTVNRGGSTGNITLTDLATGTNLINTNFTFDVNAGALDLDVHPLLGVNSGPSDSSAFFFGLHKWAYGSLT